MRTNDQLVSLLGDIKVWFSQEMGIPCSAESIMEPLVEMRKGRIRDFIKRRLSHLPDTDLIKFIQLIEKEVLQVSTPQSSNLDLLKRAKRVSKEGA